MQILTKLKKRKKIIKKVFNTIENGLKEGFL